MELKIYSRKALEATMNQSFFYKTAVISFAAPKNEKDRLRFDGLCKKTFYVTIPDIDIERLTDYGYTYENYLANADELAKFIYEAKADGCDIICQCDYGQSRSAACAAAILQHFEGRGIDIFTDYRYYPNQLVYHKVFDALEAYAKQAK